jgi:hypothetical protein
MKQFQLLHISQCSAIHIHPMHGWKLSGFSNTWCTQEPASNKSATPGALGSQPATSQQHLVHSEPASNKSATPGALRSQPATSQQHLVHSGASQQQVNHTTPAPSGGKILVIPFTRETLVIPEPFHYRPLSRKTPVIPFQPTVFTRTRQLSCVSHDIIRFTGHDAENERR